MTKTKIRRPRSLRLDHFPPQELEQLADAYDEIRARLRELRALTKVRLPPANDRTERLAALRALDKRGQLTIRISEGGNLSVRARLAASVGEQEMYAVLIRRPAIRG
jgi:hypothetical protein